MSNNCILRIVGPDGHDRPGHATQPAIHPGLYRIDRGHTLLGNIKIGYKIGVY